MDGFFNNQLSITDPEISNAIENEKIRQKEQVELIASENIVSQAVLDAQGSILTNKYVEGYSGRRYYGGCEFIDDLETIGINRAKNYLIVNMPIYNHIQVLRLTKLYLCLLLNQVIQF